MSPSPRSVNQLTKNYVDPLVTASAPVVKWVEKTYVMKDKSDNLIGLFRGPVDVNASVSFTLYQMKDPQGELTPLEAMELESIDYETQLAFETLPSLTIWQYAPGGILLQYADGS